MNLLFIIVHYFVILKIIKIKIPARIFSKKYNILLCFSFYGIENGIKPNYFDSEFGKTEKF